VEGRQVSHGVARLAERAALDLYPGTSGIQVFEQQGEVGPVIGDPRIPAARCRDVHGVGDLRVKRDFVSIPLGYPLAGLRFTPSQLGHHARRAAWRLIGIGQSDSVAASHLSDSDRFAPGVGHVATQSGTLERAIEPFGSQVSDVFGNGF
jgi:hypothetical protein